MKCGACAGSACVSCLVVGGAESDVVRSVHWCGVAVRGHAVWGVVGCVAVGCCGVICRLIRCFMLHLFFDRCAGRGGEEVPEGPLPVVLAPQPSPSRADWWC